MKKNLLLLPFLLFLLLIAVPAHAEILPFCAYSGSCQMCDFIRLAVILADWGLGVIGGIALVFFIIGGVYLVTGGYKPDMLTKGKTIMTQAITGLLIVLSAWLIVNFVITAFAGTDSNISKEWYAPPVCNDRSVGEPTDKVNSCYKLYLKDQATSETTSEADKKKWAEDDCEALLNKYRDTADCGDNNIIQWNAEHGTIKCVSKCKYMADIAQDDRSCQSETSCDASTIKRGWCPGKTEVCCSPPK